MISTVLSPIWEGAPMGDRLDPYGATMPSLQAVMAERKIISKLMQLSTFVTYPLQQLETVAADCIPAKRVNTAMHYLTQTWGDRPIPPTEYLDMVFALDTVINYRGWVIGLDVTLNPEAIASKQAKQAQLMPAYRRLGIDVVGVINAHEDLKPQLRAIIKSAQKTF